MDVLMVLIALIGIAVSIASKKNQAKAKQQKTAADPHRQPAAPKAAPARSAPNRTSPPASPAAPSKFPTPGASKWGGSPAKPQAKPATANYGGTPRYTHVVQSTLEGGHTHTESSMTGEEACPPPKAAAARHPEAEPVAAANVGGLLSFQPNSVLQGVLFSEILGKPKSQR